MFEPVDGPRVFGLPPGADFPNAIAEELIRRFQEQPPEALARVHIFVNSARMRRRMTECLTNGAPRVLPRISLVSDLVPMVPEADLPPAVSALERKIELSRLLRPLLDSPDAPAPRSALFDLADSLTALLDEMHTEDVSPEDILMLDIEGAPRHWALSQRFLSIVGTYLDATRDAGRDPAARQRAALARLLQRWSITPPTDPVIVAGSTGSRGTTFDLMRHVSKLPQGAVVLPGFDFHMPEDVWRSLETAEPPPEDHPQYRFAALCQALGVTSAAVRPWPVTAPDAARNALVSLSLRPAPVTDQWLRDGPGLGDLETATRGMALVLAPQPRDEAGAIAVALREAVETGLTAALVTPDRTLARRVTAALRRWAIVPDDSAGMSLSLSPPGRFLRHLAKMLGSPVDPASLIALLRHPLTRSGGDDRGQHALWTNALDLALRKRRQPVVTPDLLRGYSDPGTDHAAWCTWLAEIVAEIGSKSAETLGDMARRHIAIAERLARGQADDGAGGLWDLKSGELAQRLVNAFCTENVTHEPMSIADYTRLLDYAFSQENMRQTEASRTDVQIVGTLEARVLGSDVVILGGLNETVWPGAAAPDPWLSRHMRRAAGLLSPERQIGLSAHDYQQAIGARRVILTRSSRTDDAETVPARWLNRLTNLLSGLPDQGGASGLDTMISRGNRLLAVARDLDIPLTVRDPAPRPAPAPPPALRPRRFSVTAIEKLIRDPYWIYARHVLRIAPLPALVPEPDAALRGEVFHKIVERFVDAAREDAGLLDVSWFREVARTTLEELVPWVATRRLWQGHLDAIAPAFVAEEKIRQRTGTTLATEVRGRLELAADHFVITAEADRIDATRYGALVIYDYKSGDVPSDRQAKQFNPQVPLEALMAERGAFEGVDPARVEAGYYLSLGRAGKRTRIEIGEHVITKNGKPVDTVDFSTATTERELADLLTAYIQQTRGYPSRRAMEKMRFDGDYDHLARFGEWDETVDAEVIPLP